MLYDIYAMPYMLNMVKHIRYIITSVSGSVVGPNVCKFMGLLIMYLAFPNHDKYTLPREHTIFP